MVMLAWCGVVWSSQMSQTVCARCMSALTGQDKRNGKILCHKCEAEWERNVSVHTAAYDPRSPSAFSQNRKNAPATGKYAMEALAA